jgi:ubiquinone/menaquinone biosynthesis C-methylase UbiE
VRGLDVLDLGRAGDEHAQWLLEQGARVVEIDPSAHDLREPLPLQKESVDLVFSSLTLHYVQEWEPILREFRRVTRPGGTLVFSAHHPCRGLHDGLGVDYFSTGLVVEEQARYWRRPLHSIVNAVIETDWRIVKIAEPRIAEAVDPWFVVVKASR